MNLEDQRFRSYYISSIKIDTKSKEEQKQHLCCIYFLVDVDVTGFNTVSEKVLCTSITAAQVAVVQQLSVQGKNTTKNKQRRIK